MLATSSTQGAPVSETTTAPPETVVTESLKQPAKEGEEEEEGSITNTTETKTSQQSVTEIVEELKTLTKTAANSAYLTYDYIVSYCDKLALE